MADKKPIDIFKDCVWEELEMDDMIEEEMKERNNLGESVEEEKPYTYKQMESEIAYDLKNSKEGEFAVYFEEEAEHCKKILKRKGFDFDVKQNADGWYQFNYTKKEKAKNESLNEDLIRPQYVKNDAKMIFETSYEPVQTNRDGERYQVIRLNLICGWDYNSSYSSHRMGWVEAENWVDDARYDSVVVYIDSESDVEALAEAGYEPCERPRIIWHYDENKDDFVPIKESLHITADDSKIWRAARDGVKYSGVKMDKDSQEKIADNVIDRLHDIDDKRRK